MEMFKLKSGEEININERPESIIKKDIDGHDIYPLIIKILISMEKPLGLSELAKESGVYKEKLFYKLKDMVEKGLLLTVIEDGKKCYIPQPFFVDNEILFPLYEAIKPLTDIINKNIDYNQVKNPNTPEAFINCIQMALKLFSFKVTDLKNSD